MLIDARTLDDGHVVTTDVCIVGGGIAGMLIARECIGAGFTVSILESGGLEPDPATLSLSRGDNVGIPYNRLDDARFRGFGGNAHTWHFDIGNDALGIRMRPLDVSDFQKRDWIPYSGWPFDFSHLAPHYERAHSAFGLGPFTYEAPDWEDADHPLLPFDSAVLRTAMFQFAPRDAFLDTYRQQIIRAKNVTVYLHANVTELMTAEGGAAVETVRAATLPGGDVVILPSDGVLQRVRVVPLPRIDFGVRAKVVVLAAGGTENARLLLVSTDRHPTGLGNRHDLVGRFFMEHPHLWSGKVVATASSTASLGLYRLHRSRGTPIMGKVALAHAAARKEKLLNYCVSLHPHAFPPAGVESIGHIVDAARRTTMPYQTLRHLRQIALGLDDIVPIIARRVKDRLGVQATSPAARTFRRPVNALRLNHMSEQAPNPDSRVTLSPQRDALGMPRVRLDWRLTRLDTHTILRSQQLMDREVRRLRLGVVHIDMDGASPPASVHGGYHHMGTTRMHDDPTLGVVDSRGRVHGISNLYVAGSSLFPTVGFANPTLTIGALAIRLADDLKTLLPERVVLASERTTAHATP